jgi:hypothetical protein
MANGEQLKPAFAEELIAPFYQTQPLGEEERLTYYIYRPMYETLSTDLMMQLIDYTGSILETEDINSEYNNLKIQRLIAIVADMPDAASVEKRGAVWQHLISSDWVHMYGNSRDLDRAVMNVTDREPELGDEIRKIQQSVLAEKRAAFAEAVHGDTQLSCLAEGNASLEEAMNAYHVVREHYPEALLGYNSMIVLAMSERHLTAQAAQ